jgi:hypothetical protein
MRCKEPAFWAWLQEERGISVFSEADAVAFTRIFCGVASRAELDKPGNSEARLKWYELDNQYQAWKALEHA